MTDYTTDQLIERLYEQLGQSDAPKNTKLILDTPDVAPSNDKTCFRNFTPICDNLKRQTQDVKRYIEEELLVTSNVDANGMLYIDGKFRKPHIEKILLKYMETYVFCKECGSANTKLDKKDRIQFIECAICRSRKAL